jgi:Uma2 family endonuclease
MPVTAKTYEQVALEDSDSQWELVCGALRRKPDMTMEHNDPATYLGFQLVAQLDRAQFRLRVNSTRTTVSGGTYYVPDVLVVPTALADELRDLHVLEAYAAPLPFVAEVWSRSTGDYDVDAKFPEYRRRGDLEIWRVHPYERTVTAWRRQPDGSYLESVHRGGSVDVLSLPGVRVDLGELFAG